MHRVVPDRERFLQLWSQYEVVPVCVSLALDEHTPVGIFRRLVGSGPGYLLESLSGGEDVARYSFVGSGVRRLLRLGPLAPGGPVPDAFAALRDFVAPGRAAPAPAELGRFAGGAVGYLAYDAVRALERLPHRPRDDLALPLAVWMDCSLIAVVDHVAQRLALVVPLDRRQPPAGTGGEPGACYAAACRAIQQALAALARPLRPRPYLPAPGPDAQPAPFRASLTREQFLARVRRAREYIAAGDAFQVVLSQRFECRLPAGADAFDLYRALRSTSPSPYMFFLRPERGFALVGASPELLVRVEGRRVLTRPLAGTRPRGSTPEEDARLERDLLADEKERAEHTMLVDLGRNDVGRVSRYGSVRVTRLLAVERYSHVMHLVSDVEGELLDGRDALDALAACFPAGTLTGAPKVRAMEIIDELEPVARGPYGGAVGALGFDGRLEACIAIRTFVVRGRRVLLQCGAGIVADSDPEREYQETVNKGRAGLVALALLAGSVPPPRAAAPAGRRAGPARRGQPLGEEVSARAGAGGG